MNQHGGGVIYQVFYSWGCGSLMLAPLWFLPILALSLIIVLIFIESERYNRRWRWLFLIILVAISILTKDIPEFVIPFRLNAIPTSALFIYMGYIFKEIIHRGLSNKKIMVLAPLMIMTLWLITRENGQVNISIAQYNHYILYLLGAISGFILMMCLSFIDFKGFLSYIGKYSLMIFIINQSLNALFVRIVHLITGKQIIPMIDISPKYIAIGFVFVIITSLLLAPFLSRVYTLAYNKLK